MKKVKVIVVNGKPTISTEGFSGDECIRATERLEHLLAGEGGVEVRDTRPDAVRDSDYAD